MFARIARLAARLTPALLTRPLSEREWFLAASSHLRTVKAYCGAILTEREAAKRVRSYAS